MAKICPADVPTRISAARVLRRLRSASSRNNGTRLATEGIISKTSRAFQKNLESGIRNLAKKYAPHRAKHSVNAVPSVEMKMLFATLDEMRFQAVDPIVPMQTAPSADPALHRTAGWSSG